MDGNAVTNGLYSERQGQRGRRRGSKGGKCLSNCGSDNVNGNPAGGAKSVVSVVRAQRCSRGSGVSKDAIMGVRK